MLKGILKQMKVLKYFFSILLVIWGLLLVGAKLFSDGFQFPFLTILTIIAIGLGVSKHKRTDLFFFISACLWVVLSSETIGFVLFFDLDNYDRMIVGIIPLILGISLIISSQPKEKWDNTLFKRLLIIPVLIIIGIGSYVYKPTTEEVNCWYYFGNAKSYKILFAETPERTFEVNISSDELKKEVKKEGLQYEGREGFYCPETKVRVVTSFGNIISAKIISFRNTEKDKKVKFSRPTKIPLSRVKGNLEIIKPFTLRLWN